MLAIVYVVLNDISITQSLYFAAGARDSTSGKIGRQIFVLSGGYREYRLTDGITEWSGKSGQEDFVGGLSRRKSTPSVHKKKLRCYPYLRTFSHFMVFCEPPHVSFVSFIWLLQHPIASIVGLLCELCDCYYALCFATLGFSAGVYFMSWPGRDFGSEELNRE
uniref:Uncharacterized protein n=1 Tax=Ascaris lumbricoides TaxID=6252 RepID=A0A9J2PWB4_ASCLU